MINRLFEPAKGTWCGVGGHVERPESAKECALREIEEETGLKVNNISYVSTERIDDSINHIFYSLILNEMDVEKIKGTKEGVVAFLPIKWVLSEDNKGVTEFTRKMLIKVLKEL